MSPDWFTWLAGMLLVVGFIVAPAIRHWRKNRMEQELQDTVVSKQNCTYHPDRSSVGVEYDTDGKAVLVCDECQGRIVRIRKGMR